MVNPQHVGDAESTTAVLRERIREAAAEVWRDGLGGMTEADVLDRYADVLLPVVEAHTAEQTARLRDERDRLAAEVEQLWGQLAEAADALCAVGKAAIVVKPTLDKPFPDDLRWTPWTRFMKKPASRAYNLGHQLRRELRKPTTALDGAGEASC